MKNLKQNQESFEKLRRSILSEEFKNSDRRKKNIKPFFIGSVIAIFFFIWALGKLIDFLFVGFFEFIKMIF